MQGEDICWLESPVSQQPEAKSWQAENPDERLVSPRRFRKRSWWRGALVWELLTFGNLGLFWLVEGHRLRLRRQNRTADGEVCAAAPDGVCVVVIVTPETQLLFSKNSPPVTLRLNFNQLFRSLSIWVLPGVQRRSLKINFQSVKDKVTTGQRTSRLFLW